MCSLHIQNDHFKRLNHITLPCIRLFSVFLCLLIKIPKSHLICQICEFRFLFYFSNFILCFSPTCPLGSGLLDIFLLSGILLSWLSIFFFLGGGTRKEWLYFFARQRGNTEGQCLKNCAPFQVNCCCCLVTDSCLNLLRPHGLQPARLLCP